MVLKNTYGAEYRPIRPGKPPQRTPVARLGVTEAEQSLFQPGPGAYEPNKPGLKNSPRYSLSYRCVPCAARVHGWACESRLRRHARDHRHARAGQA